MGCGTGPHVVYLQSQGLEVVGSDVSENGLQACARNFRWLGLPARLVQADMTAAPFADGTFDAAIAVKLLNHNLRELLEATIAELWRVIKPGAELYVTVLNTWDWRYGSGKEVKPDSFVVAEEPEAGILHRFFSEQDLLDWLSASGIARLQRNGGVLTGATAPNDREVVRDEWAVHVAELRLWLQLVVDAELRFEQRKLHPLLSNLSFEVRQGDSLIQEVAGIDLSHIHGHTQLTPDMKGRLTNLLGEKRR